jgi:hypothetical protein
MVEIIENGIETMRADILRVRHALEEILTATPARRELRYKFSSFVPGEYGLSKVHCLTVNRSFWRPFGKHKLLQVNFYDELNGKPLGDVDAYNHGTDVPTYLALATDIATFLKIPIYKAPFSW